MITLRHARFGIAAIVAGLLVVAVPASAAVIVLDFEGVNAGYPSGFATVDDFYNGGTSGDGQVGPDFGITFSDNALAICLNTPGFTCSNTSRGGLGDPNSQLGALFFLSGAETFMNVEGGFDTGFSFFYTAINQSGSVSVYDGPNGTGTLLTTLFLPTTPSACDLGTYNAGFCPFFPIGVAFAGTAMSVSFAGVADQIVFDDVTFGSVTPGQTEIPEPATLTLIAGGAIAGATRRWRRRRAERS